METDEAVVNVIKKADSRLYRTLVWAPVIGRMVYFLFFACVAITGYIWRVDARLNTAAQEREEMQKQLNRSYKLYSNLYRDVHKGEEPPPQ